MTTDTPEEANLEERVRLLAAQHGQPLHTPAVVAGHRATQCAARPSSHSLRVGAVPRYPLRERQQVGSGPYRLGPLPVQEWSRRRRRTLTRRDARGRLMPSTRRQPPRPPPI